MNIKTEKDITGAVARALRDQAGENQTTFWKSVGLTQSGGSRYESGQTIPRPVRTLIFIRYVAGIKVDASTVEGANKIIELGDISRGITADKAVIGKALNDVSKAIKNAGKAISAIADEGGAA